MVHRNEEFESSCRRKVKVKDEFNDLGDDKIGFLSKRLKFDPSQEDKNGGEEKGVSSYNPLEEPSPLGLKLRKSPSFLDLIQMKLAQERKTLARKEKINGGVGGGGSGDNNNSKLKASNFPATLLKIGTWEYKSRYEGDLVAKCYFAKHKLVWEVLDGGLKNKIEIQWADIMAIKANYPDNEPGTLDVVLSRQPLFFREINPQPRKHTLWQATTDFTCGQASLHRQHFLQFPEGTLGKHFQKLIQCDPRLSFLSQQPQIVVDNPYFPQRVSIFDDQNDGENCFDIKTKGRFSLSGIRDTVSVSVSGISSSIETQNHLGSHLKLSQNNHPSNPETQVNEGEVNSRLNETHGLELLNQIKLPGLHPSMSVGDLVNHIGDCISEQMKSDNPSVSVNETQKWEILDEITQYLLNDNQTSISSDEKSIMSRVDSLCCLLQKEDTRGIQTLQHVRDLNTLDDLGPTKNHSNENLMAQGVTEMGNEIDLGNDSREGTGMSRKDSVGELLLHLPRIASLPQFLIPQE